MKDKRRLNKILKLVFSLIIFFFIWFAPAAIFGISGLTVIEQRVMAIFALATLFWVLEIIPVWATSVLIIGLFLFTTSDSSLFFLRPEHLQNGQQLGTLISYRALFATFADPLIFLFIGGFVLAIAAPKCGLDVTLARILLKPFGNRYEYVLLGFLIATGCFSMFLSNTATAALMLTFLTPIFKTLPENSNGRMGLALSIPIGANIGGMATIVGTPPNAIAVKYLNAAPFNMNIGFMDWTEIMLPIVIILLFMAWIVLIKMFPFKSQTIDIKIEGKAQKNTKAIITYVTFAVTVLMWLLDKVTGVNSNIVAMIPICVFAMTGILTKDDLGKINWSVLWLFSGGFALGLGLKASGLANHVIETIPFGEWSPLVLIIGSGLLCWVLSNFISNTATAALLVPILAVVGSAMDSTLAPLGGVSTLIVGIAMCASLAMCLPISTPPNALSFSTGCIKQKNMIKVGLIMGIGGMAIGYLFLILGGTYGLL
ncbi:MAG: SLC13 family permease [Bacteroidales bacterium]|jgi:sodium-dependent dicarboxylate transporter 2/3/5|nr:SLC13 family permease [Bacteroidales bacterium]